MAINHHKTHKDRHVTFKNLLYLRDIYMDSSPFLVIKKATQVGVSEYMIARVIDRARKGKTVLYVLPTFSLKNQFVQERVNKTILFTPLYRDFQKLIDERMAESTSVKQFGTGTIVFTGSNTPAAFVSYPADDIVIDELDECSQGYLTMAEERQSASTDKTTVKVGNPTINNYGIDAEYEKSDKKMWVIRHDCGGWITPDFFRHVVEEVEQGNWIIRDPSWEPGADILPICEKCGRSFDRFSPGEWIATGSGAVSGYHISKMFSTTMTLQEILRRFEDGLVNDTAMQRFYNGDLGLAYTARGAKIDEGILNDCVSDYLMPETSQGVSVAGIDVKTNYFNLITGEVLPEGIIKVTHISEPRDPEDCLDIMRRQNVKCFVIDAGPEKRTAAKIIALYRRGVGFMNYYASAKKELTLTRNDRIINTNRTAVIDAVKENLMLKKIMLPKNAKSIEGFYRQMTSSVRVFDEDRQEYDWQHGNEPDDYLHAMTFMLIARRLLLMAR